MRGMAASIDVPDVPDGGPSVRVADEPISRADFDAWLHRHGVEANDVQDLRFIFRRDLPVEALETASEDWLFLQVRRFLHDRSGRLFPIREDGKMVAAYELLLIPVRDMP